MNIEAHPSKQNRTHVRKHKECLQKPALVRLPYRFPDNVPEKAVLVRDILT